MSWGWVLIFTKTGTWLKAVVLFTAYILVKRVCDQNDRLRRQQRIEEACQEEHKYLRRFR